MLALCGKDRSIALLWTIHASELSKSSRAVSLCDRRVLACSESRSGICTAIASGYK